MHYNRVHIDSIGYELAPVVVPTADLERRLNPFLNKHGFRAFGIYRVIAGLIILGLAYSGMIVVS